MSRICKVAVVGISFVLWPLCASAQWVVYDPANYIQAVTRYLQLVQQYEFMVRQARRLPVNMAARYRTPEVRWRIHDFETGFPFARPILAGLNYGDAGGGLYLQAVDRLEGIDDVLARMPAALRDRLRTQYATLELADSVAQMGIHQAGAIRYNGRAVLQSIEAMEDDAVAASDDFHSQTALLNKINGASVLSLRIAERGTQFLMHTLEQLIVGNKRQRDSEAQLMNAHIYQWRYGERYGQEMFSSTAANLDRWRQP